MIRPYLRDLINEHKPTAELYNNNYNNNNNNKAEWKIQRRRQNSCISTKSFEKTRTIYTKCEPIEIVMGNVTEDVIDNLFNTLLKRFQKVHQTSNDNGSEFIPDSSKLL